MASAALEEMPKPFPEEKALACRLVLTWLGLQPSSWPTCSGEQHGEGLQQGEACISVRPNGSTPRWQQLPELNEAKQPRKRFSW